MQIDSTLNFLFLNIGVYKLAAATQKDLRSCWHQLDGNQIAAKVVAICPRLF